VDPHRLAELRSLALHREIAGRVARDPQLVGEALARLARMRASGALHPALCDAWTSALAGPREELLRVLVEESERARELRQSTPFAGVVPPRERWAIWRRVAEAW
jgi:hypothetical protein